MDKAKQHIVNLSDKLQEAASSVKILRNIAWPKSVKEEFFKYKAEKLPVVSYAPYDPTLVLEQTRQTRKLIGLEDSAVNRWANRIADKIESSALLLGTRGTMDFLTHSVSLYGKPTDSLQNSSLTTLELAQHFDNMFGIVKDGNLGNPPEACVLSQSLAEEMEKVVQENFGSLAPEIVMDDNLASNVLAGRRRVSIRPTACFSDLDVKQLIQHELFVHVATSLNGSLQPYLKILKEGHPGTTKTQEGLAVFAEFITGSIDLDRVRRLSDRVIAIQMAIEGADFMEVYKYYLEKTDDKDQSFESAKRVFRGGMVSGRVPFMKDIVYLEGLINVHTFLKVALSSSKLEYLDLLFVGKLDISDIPVLKEFADIGLIEKPKYMAPWLQDKRYLLAYLSYSSFITGLDMNHLKKYYETMLGE